MIYNYIQFLRNIYFDVIFFVNETRLTNDNLPERYCIVRETGGVDKSCLEENTIQIKIHDVDSSRAKLLAEEIYYTSINADNWHGRFFLTLPEANVNINNVNITYPTILIESIQALQKPSYIGLDENNRAMYSFNLIFRKGG